MANNLNSIQNNITPVNYYNEWDPLEEFIVCRLEGATIPLYHVTVTYTIPAKASKLYGLFAGHRYPGFLVKQAQKELNEFIHILESEGVVVRRPELTDYSILYKTPKWKSKVFCTACPRDGVMIVGDQLIETPMS